MDGFSLAIANRGRWTRSAEVIDISPELSRVLKGHKNIESETYCDFANPVLEEERQLALRAGVYSSLENSDLKTEFVTVTRKHGRQSGYEETGSFLEPNALLSETSNAKIREIYPVVNFKHPLFQQSTKFTFDDEVLTVGEGGALNNQILYKKEWKGFTIIAQQRPINHFVNSMKPTEYEGKHRGVLFLNDRLVAKKQARIPNLYSQTLPRIKCLKYTDIYISEPLISSALTPIP